ncbi:MAG: hypothetical protein LBE24_04250 [Methylobacillus sp.]|nr:hypothetical protein [Methylobacillus sp.]
MQVRYQAALHPESPQTHGLREGGIITESSMHAKQPAVDRHIAHPLTDV